MGEPHVVSFGGGAITVAGIIGGVIIALGFSVRLFGIVEARLIEIEQTIVAMRATPAPPTPPDGIPSPIAPPSAAT